MSEKNNEPDTLFILDLVGKRADLKVILHTVTEWLETQIPDAIVSIMLYSEQDQHLNLLSGGKHFSSQYRNALINFKVGPNAGACGAAAYYHKMIICENLSTDKNWATLQEFIQQENIAACWSIPIINAQGVLYGTFATYYRYPKRPTDAQIQLLNRAASLVALGMDLHYERKQKKAMSDKYHSFFNYHPDAVFEYDLQGYIHHANQTSKDITGFDIKDVQGHHYSEFIIHSYQEVTHAAFRQATQGSIQRIEIQAYHSFDATYWIDLTFLPIIQHQKIVGVFGIVRDISHRHQTEEFLRLLKRGIDASPHGFVITESSPNAPVVYVNPAFLELTGYTETEVLNKNCSFLQGPETDPIAIRQIKLALLEHAELKITLKNYRKDGNWFWNQLILGPVLDEKGICTHYIGIQQDITQQRIDEEYINYQHTHDNVTDLVNRQTFEELLDLSFHIQHDSDETLIVLYIDLDDFRPINENLGYIAGNELIKAVSARIQHILQEGDILSRFAGDEFALLLNNRQDQNQGVLIAEEILKLLSLPFVIDGQNIHMSASIGIATDTPQTQNSRTLLEHATQALQKAKAEGRNTWHWHVENYAKNKEADYILLRHELGMALQKDQFKLVYQPITETSTGKIKCVEALARWYHPELGLILPGSFIPLAERTGQIFAIGNWVLQQVCLDIVHLNQKRAEPLSVAVNISPLQFRRAGFVEEIHRILLETTLSPELLKIEVTESVLISGADCAIKILESIRALGVKISIDDFGTGYSSLSYLRQLPIDEIKLDRSFIQALPQQHRDAAIAEAIINMAHALNLEVVAEGVETEQQAKFLIEHQCDYLQGYYLAKPAALNQLELL